MLASQNIVIILCGNKKDLDADREVTFLEASRFAQENGEIKSSPSCRILEEKPLTVGCPLSVSATRG